jgi:hypothetical protein
MVTLLEWVMLLVDVMAQRGLLCSVHYLDHGAGAGCLVVAKWWPDGSRDYTKCLV